MELPAPPPSSAAAAAADPLPPLPATPPKLRLMCSYGGHIVPRPQGKSLWYSGGETRLVGVDRRTTASSLSALTAHLSRTLYNNRPFHLKYQLPNEDLDSLISVTTDEDLQNMLEEHDRVSAVVSRTPPRIRLFLFPIKAESVGSVLLDPKSDTWFSDALKNTAIIQRGQSADAGLGRELMGLDNMVRPDGNVASEAQIESLGNTGGCEAKEIGGTVPESFVLETTSSFGSTSSSISMSNLPAMGVQSEDAAAGFFEKKIRVPSSASLESDCSAASAGIPPKAGVYQVASGVSSFVAEMDSSVSDPQSVLQTPKNLPLPGYQLSQQYNYIPGDPHYVSQFQSGPSPHPSYYPVYQMPMHQQLQSPYPVNQPYPVYLVPVRANQNYSMPMQYSIMDNANIAASRPPLHPQTAIIAPVTSKDTIPVHAMPESASKVYQIPAPAVVVTPATQVKPQFVELPELQHPSQPAAGTPVASSNYVNELNDDIAFSQIYKTQPSAPTFPL
ncbi:OLC1v1010702C1 [Oldenlandia corymbosa var. corymbosa]|uniref:OLC1v1010702C1 n=1 Tax=Oldenlandia corymbosa var. corymbosa TaxID=529605 RepID=A0AAV1DUE9_OLDCO|nr:OLC1v1010702C1 [Oldenlandia corymbosa var. corymbosa]